MQIFRADVYFYFLVSQKKYLMHIALYMIVDCENVALHEQHISFNFCSSLWPFSSRMVFILTFPKKEEGGKKKQRLTGAALNKSNKKTHPNKCNLTSVVLD